MFWSQSRLGQGICDLEGDLLPKIGDSLNPGEDSDTEWRREMLGGNGSEGFGS